MAPTPAPPGRPTAGSGARAASRPRDVDQLIARAPADKRQALRAIRETIRKTAPDALEAVAYGGLAQYKYRGRVLLYFGYASGHVALYGPIGVYLDAHPEDLRRYTVSKGTLRLPSDTPIPRRLVAGVVRARMRELDAKV